MDLFASDENENYHKTHLNCWSRCVTVACSGDLFEVPHVESGPQYFADVVGKSDHKSHRKHTVGGEEAAFSNAVVSVRC